MNNLNILSKCFRYAAIVSLAVAVYILLGDDNQGINAFKPHDQRNIIFYLLLMIPVVFASLSITLKQIIKAIDPDYQSKKRKRHEPPMVLPPE